MTKEFLIAIFFLFALPGCKKTAQDPYGTNKPDIATFEITNPCTGTVVITGATFDPDITQDSIYFGNVKGEIISATNYQIVANMPPANIAGTITVWCEGRPNVSKDSVYQYIPQITSYTPAIAGPGTQIVISGHGFNPNPIHDSVYFGNTRVVIYSADTNKIVVIAPSQKTTGLISIRSNCQVTTALGTFTQSDKGAVYIGGNNLNFYCIDITSGAVRWTYPITSSGYSPAYSNGVVYIGGQPGGNQPGQFYALDATTGKLLWNLPIAPGITGHVVISHDTIFAGSADNNMYALNTLNGQELWHFLAGVNGYFQFSPVYDNGAIYAPNENGYVYSLNAATGNLNWKSFISPGGISVSNGMVYAAGSDSLNAPYLYALNAATGQVVWKLYIYYMYGLPLVQNGVVYIGDGYGNLFAIDALTGNQLWKNSAGGWSSFAQMVGNTIFATGGGGYLRAFDAPSGNLIWNVQLIQNPFYQPGPVVANGEIFVGDSNGTVHAIDAATGNTIWTLPGTGGNSGSPVIVDSAGNSFSGAQ